MPRILAFSLIVWASSGQSHAQDTLPETPRFTLSGYVKSLQSFFFADDLDQLTTLNQIHQRFNINWQLSASLSLRAGMRNRVLWGDYLRYVPDRGDVLDGQAGCADLSVLWINEPAFVVHSVFDRLALHYATRKVEVRAGRQRINWGLHAVWNPNDIFNAYSILDFDYEERPGTDAVRVQYFLSGLSTIEFAAACGADGNPGSFAGYYKFNTSGYDIQTFAGRAGPDLVAGAGWAGHIGDAGFKGELTYFHPAGNMPDSNASLSCAIGVDRTFGSDWYISAGGLYQSKAFPTGRIQDWVTGTSITAKSLMPFQLSWYGGFVKSFSPVAQLQFSLIYSPKNTSLILLPSFSRNLADNLDLDVFVQSFFADNGTSYVSAGQAFFLRFRWSY